MSRRRTVALVVAVVALACNRSIPSVDLPQLNATDLQVMQTVVEAVIRPALAQTGAVEAVVASPTRVVPLWHPPGRGNLPPAPPAEFRASAPVPAPPDPPWLDEGQLTADERTVWRTRNRFGRKIPELGLAGLRAGDDRVQFATRAVVGLSAPAYPTETSAVIYADMRCGGLGGTGWLIRLVKVGDEWHVTQSITVLKSRAR